jgi:hypothetical protein
MVKLRRRKNGNGNGKRDKRKDNRGRKKKVSDEEIINALKASGGFKSVAARMLGVTAPAISWRAKRSKLIAEQLRTIESEYLDIAELELLSLIRQGSLGAICFYLKCKGKHRGYIERTEVDSRVVVGSGVLVVPGVANSTGEWLASLKDVTPQPQLSETN